MLRVIVRKARSFTRLPRFSQIYFIPLWVLLGLAKAVIVALSFRRLAPRLGVATDVAPWVPLIDVRQRTRALQIGRAVRLAARYTPWESNCFPQAVAARVLLGLFGIPYVLCFGLSRTAESSAVLAHAWVAAGPVAVTGGHGFDQYAVVGVFAAPGWLSE